MRKKEEERNWNSEMNKRKTQKNEKSLHIKQEQEQRQAQYLRNPSRFVRREKTKNDLI